MATKKEVRTEVIGREWDDAFYTGIRKITITYSCYAIGSIEVVYDLNGRRINGNKHYAGTDFPYKKEITLDDGESIVKVTGYTVRVASVEVVRSLTFTTNLKSEIINGDQEKESTRDLNEERTPFVLPIKDGRKVVGFKGVTDGVLNSIGVHSVPLYN